MGSEISCLILITKAKHLPSFFLSSGALQAFNKTKLSWLVKEKSTNSRWKHESDFYHQLISTFLLDSNDKFLIGCGQIGFKQLPNALVALVYPFVPVDATSSILKLVIEELKIVSKVMESSYI